MIARFRHFVFLAVGLMVIVELIGWFYVPSDRKSSVLGSYSHQHRAYAVLGLPRHGAD